MITPRLKANAIALLKMGDSPQKVSEDLELPYMLVKEWHDELDLSDLTTLQANTLAVSKILEGEVLYSNDNVDKLKTKIEETAILIIDRAKDYVHFPDLPSAKALELLANTCSKLYMTIITKQTGPQNPNSGVSLLEQLGRD